MLVQGSLVYDKLEIYNYSNLKQLIGFKLN